MMPKLRVLFAAAGMSAVALFAFAADDPMAVTFENTVESADEAGAVTKVMYNADNTYSVILPTGATGKGTWKVDAGQLCVNRTEPPPGANFCMPVDSVPSQVGESKDATTSDGRKFKNTLKAGRS
jgi:hypothetical protein